MRLQLRSKSTDERKHFGQIFPRDPFVHRVEHPFADRAIQEAYFS